MKPVSSESVAFRQLACQTDELLIVQDSFESDLTAQVRGRESERLVARDSELRLKPLA